MKDDSQTRQGAGAPIVDLLKPKRKMRVGCWNVQTLYQTGKMPQLVKEFDNYNLDILGVSEVRWTGTGKRRLASGHTILFSGRPDDQHSEGVGLLLNQKTEKALLEWKPYGPRLLRARFYSRYTKLTVIVCYAPTEDKEAEDKDAFYDQLQAATESVRAHDILLILGDLNAKVGSDNIGREHVMGKCGIGTMNDNGERLADFCEGNNLLIGGTLFQHKDIHKTTWTSPDGVTKNQIDHIMINRKWKSSLQDVRAYRGADVASDHTLVIATVSLKLRRARERQARQQRVDSGRLKEPTTKQAYVLEVKNRFQVLGDEQEMTIDSFNQALLEAGEKVLGFQRRRKEAWIKDETWEKINERKSTKQKIDATRSERLKEQHRRKYTELNKEVRKMTKADKRDYIEKLADKAEEAARRNDLKTLYKINKQLSNDFQNSDVPVKDRNGKIIEGEIDKIQRWKEHFESVLNRPDPPQLADIQPADEDLDICTDPPSLEEVSAAIRKMKSSKAPGADGVAAEMMKADVSVTAPILTDIFKQVWESGQLPEAWKTGLIFKLPKKGDLGDCNNWRGITLLSLTSKVFSRIVMSRLTAALEKDLRPQQAGYRPGRSGSEHIFTLRQILEQSNEWNSSLYITFIDLEKAFDSIHRESLWKILRHYGVPAKLVRVVSMLYSDFRCQVICDTELTGTFNISSGVKQGCILSPFLFILAMDWIMKNSTEGERRGIRWTMTMAATTTLEDLDFADDIALLSHRHQDMQEKTDAMSTTAGSLGLKISAKKTKSMRMNARVHDNIRLNGENIEEVSDFTYLGSKMSNTGDGEVEIRARLAKASHAFTKLKSTWRARQISLRTKLRIFKSNVISTLLYGSESWKMTKTISHKLDVFQNRCLRRILQIFWPNTISNEELHQRTEVEPITTQVQRRRWRWIGHVLRQQTTSLSRVALRWTPDGRRKRGRPKETWRRTVEREMKEKGWTWGRLGRVSADRHQWRALVEALCAT